MDEPISLRGERRARLLHDLRVELALADAELELLGAIDEVILTKADKAANTRDPLDRAFEVACLRLVEVTPATRATILYLEGKRLRVRESSSRDLLDSSCRVGPNLKKLLRSSKGLTRVSHQDLELVRTGCPAVILRADQESIPFAYLLLEGFDPDENDAIFVESVARQLAVANRYGDLVPPRDVATLYGDLDATFFPISRKASQSVQELVFDKLSQTLLRLLENAEVKVQFLFPAPGSRLRIVHTSGAADPEYAVDVAKSLAGRAYAQDRTLVVSDVSKSKLYVNTVGQNMRSECVTPIRVGDRIIALLNAESPDAGYFDGYRANIVKRFARKISFLVAFAKIHEDVAEQLERQHASEAFVAMGINAANMIHTARGDWGVLKSHLIRAPKIAAGPEFSKWTDSLAATAAMATDNLARFRDDLKERPFDINEEVKRILDRLGRRPNVKLLTQYDPRLPLVNGLAIPKALENVLANAFDAVGGVESPYVSVETSLLRPPLGASNHYIRVVVLDNGSGIPEEQMDKIYDPGWTTKATKPELRGGMGVGLFITRIVVSRVGGELTIRSSPKGTECEILLPVEQAQETMP